MVVSLAEFKQLVEPLDEASFGDDASRKQAIQAARSLLSRLEKPMDTMLRVGWSEPSHATALKIGIDCGLFAALAKDGEHGKKNVEELAQLTKTDPAFLIRILRVLAAHDSIQEVSESVFSPTKLSLALLDPKVHSAINFRWYTTDPSFKHLPRFLAETGYKNPTNSHDTPFQYAFQTRLSHFDYVSTQPRELEVFGNHMAGYSSQRGTWEQFYPVQERVLGSGASDDVVLVDMGGGSGHDVSRFASKFLPHSEKSRLVLQDLPEVITKVEKDAALPGAVKPMAHNFFEEQPIKGAHAYYLHSVLHDWPDDKAIDILKALRPALLQKTVDGKMPKLLLNENVIPSKGAKSQPSSLDLMMCAFHAASERSENQWKDLVEKAGYKVTDIVVNEAFDEGIVEAEAI